MELPKYFVVEQNKKNSLWKEYIKWLEKVYGYEWYDYSSKYYGYDGNSNFKGTYHSDEISDFHNNPTIITLEQWNECVNGFKLPEKWYVKATLENRDILRIWTQGIYTIWEDNKIVMLSDKMWEYINYVSSLYEEITFEQFKKYVLKQKEMKKIKGYKLIKPEYKKAAIEIVNLFVDWNKGRSFESTMSNNPDNYYIEKLTEAGVLDIWFEPVYEDEKIMLDNSKHEIVIKGNKTYIDDYLFKEEFWECAKIIAEHSKADVVLGCGAKDIRSGHRWSVSLETINKVLDRIS